MTQKRIFDLPIGPGQYTEQSERGAKGRWYRMDKVRFRKGLAEKIGGWIQLGPQFIGVCRRLKDWSSLDNQRWAAIATEVKLYLWQDGEPPTLFNITPLRRTVTLTAPFDTPSSSSTVTVNDVAHGAQVGDYVTFSNTVDGPGSGIVFDGEWVIQTADTDSYTIDVSPQVSNGGGPWSNEGGTAVLAEYELTPGASTAITATGYGSGPYGAEGYGAARTVVSTIIVPIRTWHLDTWGEDLLASPRGGGIYWWDRSKGTSARAELLTEAPITNEAMVVSQRDRHVIALGAYDFFNQADDPLLIRWCSTEDLNDWVPTSTNTSGDLRLYTGSKIVTGVRSRLETVIFTDTAVHTLPFIGGFDVFGLNIVGENVSILGPMCAIPVDHRVFFMAEADFYVYDGVVKVLPCDVRNLVYDNLNTLQRDKVAGGINREFNEIWWFYPSFDPNAWVQDDFSLGIPSGYEVARSLGGADVGYSYTFDPAGYTERTPVLDQGYEHDYVLINDEPIITPLESEYAVEIDVNPDIAMGTGRAGLCFLRTDVTGMLPQQDADDCNQFMFELDYANDQLRVTKKEAAPVTNPDNLLSNTASFTTVTGSAMATDTKYVLTAQVNGSQITCFVDGVQAFQFTMSAAEIALFTGGTCGLHASPDTVSQQYRFYNFAAGPLNVLTATDFDISPIEVNKYVTYNYEEGSWATGSLARTAWADRSPLVEKPYAAAVDGYLYQHETGTDDNGAAMEAFIESFDFEIPDAGEELMHVDQLIPDFLTLEGDVSVELTGRKYPQDPNRIEKGPYTVRNGVRKLSTRMRARQVAIKVSSNQTGSRWRMGTWRGRAGPHGKRG